MPNCRLPPLTLKPTAFGSLLSGNVTVPYPVDPATSFKVAPLPMNRAASVMAMDSRSPCNRATMPSSSGSSTPLTTERLTATMALPSTTSAMLRPTVPPMRKVGSVGPRSTPAPERTLVVRPVCFQSSTRPPVTEVRFNWSERFVPMIFTTSTPCNRAVPSEPSNPVNFRTVFKVL